MTRSKTSHASKKKRAGQSEYIGRIRAEVGRAKAGRYGALNITSAIDSFRAKLKVGEILPAVRALSAHPAYSSLVWPQPFPRKWSEFSDSGSHSYLPYQNEVEWVCSAFVVYAAEISAFLKKKEAFDLLLLTGEVNSAEIKLNEIQEEFGFSLWLAESRITLYQYSSKYKLLRDYTRSVHSELSSSVGRFILAWIALKHEENTSYAQIRRLIDKFASRDLVRRV